MDGTTVLVMTERQGIEIDYCPACRGVWLDRGELDKIIDRAAADLAAAGAPPVPVAARPPGSMPVPDIRSVPARAWGSAPPHGSTSSSAAPRATKKKKKATSFLSELFEM